MALVNLRFIVKEMTEQRLIYWQVKEGKSLLAEQPEPLTIEQSIKKLQEKLADIGTGIVLITANPAPRKERKGVNTTLTRKWTLDLDNEKQDDTPSAARSYAYHGPQYEKLQHELLALEREKLRLEYKAERLEDELIKARQEAQQLRDQLAEYDDDDGDGIGALSSKAMQSAITNGLINWLTGQAGGAPAPPTAPAVHGLNSFDTWTEKDPDAPRLASAIVMVIDQDPSTYKMIKNILLTKFS